MFKIHKKLKYPPLHLARAAPRVAVRFEEPFRPEEVRMSVEGNGKLAESGPTTVIAINAQIPADFVPAFAISVLIDKSGKVVMDADLTQLDLVLHLVTAAMNTTIAATRMRLRPTEESRIHRV